MSSGQTIAAIRSYEAHVTVRWDGVTVQCTDEGEASEEEVVYSNLREAALARPEVFGEDLELEGIDGDTLARLLGTWGAPVAGFGAGNRWYERRNGVLSPSEGPDEADYVAVAARVDTRYGGDFGPMDTTVGIELGHVGAFWLVREYENGWRPVGWFDSYEEGLAAAARVSGTFALAVDGTLVPSPKGEEDAVWCDGKVYGYGPDGLAPVAERARRPRVSRKLIPTTIRWGARATQYKLLAGTSFTGETTWYGATVAHTGSWDPTEAAPADDDDKGFVLVVREPDLATPLWLTLARLVAAARTWDPSGEQRGAWTDLRPPPVLAEFADGRRCYGVAVPPVVAAATAAAFGQPCWWSISDGALVARWFDGEALTGGQCTIAPAVAPVEGDHLWDDERFGSAPNAAAAALAALAGEP